MQNPHEGMGAVAWTLFALLLAACMGGAVILAWALP